MADAEVVLRASEALICGELVEACSSGEIGCQAALASYSQESTRFVNYYKKGEIRVVQPLDLTPEQFACWVVAVQQAEQNYNLLTEAGCKPEVARDVLPTCTAADIVCTANFREWRHIIKLRTSTAAHPKIRQLIGQARDLLREIAPSVFA